MKDRFACFDIGKTVKVIAKHSSQVMNRFDILTDCDIELGVKTGDVGVIVRHPVLSANDGLFVYVNIDKDHPHYAFFPEQLEIMDTN